MSVDRRYALLRHDHGMGSPEPFSISSAADGEFIQYNSTSGKWENFDLYAAANTWTAKNTFSDEVDVAQALRVTGSSSPASGAGLELTYSSGTGYITGYDRDGTAYLDLMYRALDTHSFQINGTTRLVLHDSWPTWNNRAINGGGGLTTLDAATTLDSTHFGYTLMHFSGTAHTWTIPPNSTTAFPNGTCWQIINNSGAGTLTLARGSGVALYGRGSSSIGDADKSVAAGTVCWLLKYATDSWVVITTGGVT